jgi:(E)-4-hydroxy-3-methylbut-2-enyl-diphosphate synthase
LPLQQTGHDVVEIQVGDAADLDAAATPGGTVLWSVDPAAANLPGLYRHLAAWLAHQSRNDLIVLRDRTDGTPEGNMAAAARLGSILADGIGDLIHVDSAASVQASLNLAYDILQAAAVRRSKPEYVACPGCGRTLFDLQSTTQRIRAKTAHLKNISIAVMGCIVNGPGEMADADFGYVGGAPNKVSLYVGRECVQKNIPEDDAPEALVDLIKSHGRWIDP